TDVPLRNACEWVIAGRTKLYVLTQTSDSAYRAQLQLNPPTLRAGRFKASCYFPKPLADPGGLNPGGLFEAAVPTYNHLDARDTTNTLARTGKPNGWHGQGFIAIADTAVTAGDTEPTAALQDQVSKETVYEVLRHEVQHAADRHRGRELRGRVRA